MEETKVNLAISLHAPSDEIRSQLMPVNRKYSLQQLMACCRSLPMPRRKRITFEYVLLRGINDSPEAAEALCQLLQGIRCKVNVIPFNPHPGSRYERPADRNIEAFQETLHAHGLQINIRRPRGDDIQAACGQLQGEELHPRQSQTLLAGAVQ
jgi:23S rRNA (adenine2503-C2)-methyltransferase